MNRAFSTYVLPVVLFVVVVGGLTWVVQFMPSWTSPGPAPTPGPGGTSPAREILRFSRPGGQQIGPLRAVWELDDEGLDTGYVLEYERGKDGHYCFPFRNLLDTPAELGLLRVDCDCSSADACVLSADEAPKIEEQLAAAPWAEPAFAKPPAWHKFSRDEAHGLQVPPRGHGLLRISWKGRKNPGELLHIDLRFWCKSDADPNARQVEQVVVPVVMVLPLMVEPNKQDVGILGPGDVRAAKFHFWSATEDEPDVSFALPQPDPLFQIDARPLTADERRQLQQKISGKEVHRRIRAAYLVTATVRERKGELQMDQGPFALAVPVKLDQLAVEGLGTVQVTGTVRGEVEVGGPDDRGKVQLKTFAAAEDKVVVVALRADPKARIEVVGHSPECLQVTVKHNAKESTPQSGQWDLKVTVPAGSWSGPMPEHAHVLLRVPGNPPRQVRIPVVGNATRAR